MRTLHLLHGALMALLALATVASCAAAGLQFPSIPSSPGQAAATFGERAAAVIAFNACSRETDYLDFRSQMRGDGSPLSGDYSNEGENLTNILLAKVMWVRSHRRDDRCKGVMFRPRERNADNTFKQATLGQFAIVDRAARAAEPLLCGKETAESAIEDAILVNVELTQSCMIRQINASIMAMQKVGQMGSSDLVCVESLNFGSAGEWDINVRELVRLLYASWPNPPSQGGVSLLDDETVDHMYRHLLAARGAPSDDDYSMLGDCSEPAGDELGTPEDTADRHAWYRELFSDIGDVFEWLKSFPIKLAGSGLSSAAGLVAAPFLLAAGDDPFPAIFPHWDVRVAETENHRLMIETSRFLTNAEIIRTLEAEDYDRVEDVKADQVRVRNWLLQRLQQIAAHDFDEYNARPYTRYSLEALLNLHDFTSRQADPALQTAAHIVLDLSAAKFAAESNRGRRIVPFRRLSDNDGADAVGDPGTPGDLYNTFSGADFEVARALVLYGQTQLLPEGAPLAGIGTLVNTASSSYRPPISVFEAAVEPDTVRNQIVVNAGIEMISRSHAFTLSAGGVRTGPTLATLGFSRDKDRGVAMPTVIIATSAGTKIGELFRFRGVGGQHGRLDNLCVQGGFACGISPALSAAFDCGVGSVVGGEAVRFVNSANCIRGNPRVQMPGPHFYYALRSVDCDGRFCHNGATWALSEIIEAPNAIAGSDPDFERFRREREAALKAATPDASGQGTYVAADGRRIDFTVAEERPEVLSVNGVATPAYTTRGDLIEADGQGRATIKGTAPVTIDFSDWSNPKRSP